MNRSEAASPRDAYVALAEQAIRTYVTERRIVDPPTEMAEGMSRSAGTFVSIKKQGVLRGCIGTFAPTEPTVAAEVIANAIQSATADPRFPPIVPSELDELTISVDVLSEPEPCAAADLDPNRFGVIVECGWRRGLLLPALPGVDSVEQQIEIARRKAGIAAGEAIELHRFVVERHE